MSKSVVLFLNEDIGLYAKHILLPTSMALAGTLGANTYNGIEMTSNLAPVLATSGVAALVNAKDIIKKKSTSKK